MASRSVPIGELIDVELTLAPSRCSASASRMDTTAEATTSAGWSRSQLLMAPI
jgi:hypothetical protein